VLYRERARGEMLREEERESRKDMVEARSTDIRLIEHIHAYICY